MNINHRDVGFFADVNVNCWDAQTEAQYIAPLRDVWWDRLFWVDPTAI